MRLIALALVACLVTACGGGGPQQQASAAAPITHQQKAVLQLGRVICGDCCVERVHRAFEGHAGIGRVTMHPGERDFLVEFDPKVTSPESMATILAAAGEEGAAVSPNNVRAQPEKKWVVAR